MLTGKEIAEREIITNFEEQNIQQQGIDVRVKKISKPSHVVFDAVGHIPCKGKTVKLNFEEMKPDYIRGGEKCWLLQEGYYELEFEEGCNIPADCCLQFKTRSSVVRCGGEVRSGLFDAGFHTDNMGAFLKVEVPMFISVGARVAQVIVDSSNEVENLYNGQFQGDKQRNS